MTFALSLHAPDDELRDELVPINTRWKVDEALDAAYRYFEATGRRVSIEYALIRDINDQAWRADLLGEKLNRRGRGWVHVNPIPLNPTPGSKWTASRPGVEQQFVERLRAPASRRRSATPAARTSTAPAASWPRRPPDPRTLASSGSVLVRSRRARGARQEVRAWSSSASASWPGRSRRTSTGCRCTPGTSTACRRPA